jgi:hypothetical protein
LLERCRELQQDGLDETQAAHSAAARMGEPAQLGRRLVNANRGGRDAAALLAGTVLLALGLLAILRLSGVRLLLFADAASLLTVLLLSPAFSLISAARGFTPQKFLHNLKFGAVFSGAVVSVISVITSLANLNDWETLGKNLHVSLLTLLYGLLFGAVFYAVEKWFAPPTAEHIGKLIGTL